MNTFLLVEMPARPKPAEMIRSRVNRAMGLVRDRTLAQASDREIHSLMQPYRRERYPVRMAGEASRVPMEYSLRGWRHSEQLLNHLLTDENLARAVRQSPQGERVLRSAIEEALQQRALKGYEEEWSHLSPEAINALVKRAKHDKDKQAPTPVQANEYNARMAVRDIKKGISSMKRGRLYTIMDLGTGGGGTVLPIVEKLSQDERSKLKLLLVDVMGAGLKEVVPALEKLGVQKDQIIAVRGNMSRIGSNRTLQQFEGEVDFATSGAALHHTSTINPTFSGVHKLLKKGGTFCFWDWGHAAWRAPNLVAAPKGARVVEHGMVYENGRRTVDAEKGTAFISHEPMKFVTRGKSPTEIQTAREMLSTWISLLNYPEAEKHAFLQHFDAAVKSRAPINFGEYLKRLVEKPLEKGKKPAEIYFWEGHRPPELYSTALRDIFGQRPSTLYSTGSDLLYQMKVRK